MKLNSYKNIFMFAMSFAISFSYADNKLSHQENILCPLLAKVQASAMKLDTAQRINNKYIVYTATSFLQENNIWWFSGVGDIQAASNSEAVALGKKILKKINIQTDIYGKKVGNEFICNYGPEFVQARGKKLG